MAEHSTLRSPTSTEHRTFGRRLPVGAELVDGGQVDFRLWAPAATAVDVVIGDLVVPLTPEGSGYFSTRAAAKAGARYRYRLNGEDRLYPDPASRYQPEGPDGPSVVVDPAAFTWTDSGWRGRSLEGQVIYELHVGTFTGEGTWAAAQRELEELARIGVTVVELMPVAEFEGRFGWGYDGVDMFAPSHLYGTPDDLRRFVDRAHELGLAVILDVVYNHFGPVGNYLHAIAPPFFTTRYENEWGDAINFDGENAAGVREFFVANAGYWIDEFHMDGLRLDATQQIFDHSPVNIVAAIGARVREQARGRDTIIVAENEPQDVRLIGPVSEGGFGLDGLWNDDFHHSAMVAATGRAEAYYSDTRGEPQEFISAAKYGYLYQGQYYDWQRKPRGTPGLGVAPWRFVTYLQNHDQVANAARGLRGHALSSPAKWRALTALLLLAPGTPMLFQGQEFGSSAPFLYFADFAEPLAEAVRKGRREFLMQFPSIRDYASRAALDNPGEPATFERCKLDFGERVAHAPIYDLHKDLLALRREHAALRNHQPGGVDGAVLAPQAFLLRYLTGSPDDERLLLVNLGAEVKRSSFAEPLLAPPADRDWTIAWSSEHPRYGGLGCPDIRPAGCWYLPAESAVLLATTTERRDWRPAVRRRTA
jgi:maltooligosyltrehalose trehalohydrolase